MSAHSTLQRHRLAESGPILWRSPGEIDTSQPRVMLAQQPDYHMFDSLAVDAEGNVCVATLITGGISIHSPDGQQVEFIETPDVLTTNIAFGGTDLKTAFITLSSTGQLVKMDWATQGLRLNFRLVNESRRSTE